ncbi:hypothetical protein PEPS_14860 [Persicobacter psychrovividus]|uniref:Outer membrane protein beta-barrel domain-containing protein n=2 Tax=Persicobacter psychrovividus TaxID=387638 RepID=A0ABN6L7L6_9BACT|nr:hypothetical protein PEPS_14860 [Persicobacter psychrovividus]
MVFAFWGAVNPEKAVAQYNLSDVYATRTPIKYSPFRKILNMFSLDVGVGSGRAFYNQDLSGYDLYYQNNIPMLGLPQENGGMDSVAFSNWLTDPQRVAINGNTGAGGNFPDIPTPIQPGGGINTGVIDSAGAVTHFPAGSFPELGYRGVATTVPINLSLFFNYKKFRVGLGFEAEHHKLSYLNPYNSYDSQIGSHVVDISTWNFKYNLLLGYNFFDFMGWSYYAELGIGKYNMGKAFNEAVNHPSIDVQLAMPMYYNVSEYFRLYVRPSYEMRSYNTVLPQTTSSIKTSQNGFSISFGLSFTFPEIKRCPIPNCSTQQKHQHGDRAFRGQPIFYPQDPQIGQIPQFYQKLRWKKLPLRKGKGKSSSGSKTNNASDYSKDAE